MRYITSDLMWSMVDEFRKEAASPIGAALRYATPAGKFLTGTYGKQMALGAGVGALGGYAADKDHRLRGALMGGALGAGAVGVGQLATAKGRKAGKNLLKDTWKRSKYQFTGHGVPNEAEAQRLKIIGAAPASDANARVIARHKAEIDSYRKGHMNIPGAVHGLVTKPGEVVRGAWNRMDRIGKLFTGLSGVDAAHEAFKPTEEGGPGRSERVLTSLGSSVGFMAAPSGIAPSLLMGSLGGSIGKTVGKGADSVGRLLSRKPAVPAEQNIPETVGA